MSELNKFTRLFKNIKRCKELNWQEKAILSEIISYQLDGKPFKIKDKTLAIELAMDEGSVNKFINRLSKKGILDKVTVSFASLSGGKPKRLRTITVNEINQWTQGDNAPTLKPIEKPLTQNETPKENVLSNTDISLRTLDNDKDTESATGFGKILIDKIKNNEKIEFEKVKVKLGSETVIDEATLLTFGTKKYFLKSTLKAIDKTLFN